MVHRRGELSHFLTVGSEPAYSVCRPVAKLNLSHYA
jgi:hypothetical protein